MEGTENIVVYYNGEVIRNTYEGMSFACESTFLFVVPCTTTFVRLQYELCQSVESNILKRVSNILYRSSVVVFGGLIELYVEFEHINADEFQHNPDVQDDRTEAYEEMDNDSDEEFEATYEAGDNDEDDDGGGETVTETLVVPPAVSQMMVIPPFMRNLDLDAMHAPKFPEYANIDTEQWVDGEFRIRMKYGSRKLVIVAIRSYTISKAVDYIIYESEPKMFYAQCKTYGRGCDCLIHRLY
ncbi:hypothetical protein Ahy_A09g045087 [Arachis hypogaea]|uniref:Transposase MuDR plant domain-containing protein n=1 Tax=Arachis hypogaea TaxID=3818 RepID=A0A445BLI3_ARAHY|nr:hypothetical protein Ahy_A09g045087 [Arachis hypogaea]